MRLNQRLLFSIGFLLLSACQPAVVTVEVTPTGMAADGTQQVEVTRLVETVRIEEVKRIVELAGEASAEAATNPTSASIIEVTPLPLGSESRPVQLLFAPTTSTAVISQRAGELAQALGAATGYAFAVGVLDSEQAVIDMTCSAPADTIAFLSAAGQVIANHQCGVENGLVAVSSTGYPWQLGMLIARRDSGITELADLEGKSWAVADSQNVPDFLYFQALLAEAGITPGEIVEVTGDSAAMLAVLSGEVDVASAEFIPPIMPYDERLWEYGEDPAEPSRYLGLPATRSPIGYVVVNGEPEYGGYQLRDARSRIFDVEPEIYNQTMMVELSAPIPNAVVAFGRDFPLSLARQVTAEMSAFAASDACGASLCSSDFYGWTGLLPVDPGAFDPLRQVQASLDMTDETFLSVTQ